MKFLSLRRTFLLFILCFCLPGTALWASVTNDGQVAVRVDFIKNNGQYLTTVIYPGQTAPLPSDVKKVKVKPISGLLGDESVSITVIEPTGVEKSITKFGGEITIGAEETVAPDAVKPSVKNDSNITVKIVIKKRNSSPTDHILYPDEVYTLPDHATEVSVPSQSSSFGDEKIVVTVTLADGTEAVIGGYGGTVKLIKDDQNIQIPPFSPTANS